MKCTKSLLVVDDDPDVATIIEGILRAGEYEVRAVSRGHELFPKLQAEKPDLIILDVKMPEMDGFEVLKRLKSSPETASIPVIMLTGKGQYQDVLTGYALGADYYMHKPFTSSQLINGIDLFLSAANSQKATPESAS
jgi:DNA-binding response OmpR family regulator